MRFLTLVPSLYKVTLLRNTTHTHLSVLCYTWLNCRFDICWMKCLKASVPNRKYIKSETNLLLISDAYLPCIETITLLPSVMSVLITKTSGGKMMTGSKLKWKSKTTTKKNPQFNYPTVGHCSVDNQADGRVGNVCKSTNETFFPDFSRCNKMTWGMFNWHCVFS